MKLDVPLKFQPKDSVDCGIVCLQMVFEYYGKEITFEKLKKDIPVDEIGTYSPQLGSYMIDNGFDVEIVTSHPALFTKNDYGKSSEELIAHFKVLQESSKVEKNKKILQYFIDFLDKGGKITVKIPDRRDIEEELKDKRPVCALLTSNFLKGSKPIFNFHFNVVTGIENDSVYVNDPVSDERGGKQIHTIPEFFYGIYAATYGDLDNGSIMKLKPKHKL